MKVFITGASSGIGAALARAYASAGAHCALVARRGDALEALRASLPDPASHRVHAVDVTDGPAFAEVAAAVIADWGVPDVVIANAGISGGTTTGSARDLAAFRRIIDTNLIATVATFTPFVAAIRALPEAGIERRLVAIASVAGIRGLPGAGAYSASKAAVIAYAEALRIELRDTGARVVTIAPGYIATPMTQGNPYRMPFLMPVEDFASRAVQAITAGRGFVVIPWPMAWVARLLRVLPNAWFDMAAGKARRKPPLDDAA